VIGQETRIQGVRVVEVVYLPLEHGQVAQVLIIRVVADVADVLRAQGLDHGPGESRLPFENLSYTLNIRIIIIIFNYMIKVPKIKR
jgi:hypothetical protein